MRKTLNILVVVAVVFTLSIFNFSNASQLNQTQINAIINMLTAFGADSNTISQVRIALSGGGATSYGGYNSGYTGGYSSGGNTGGYNNSGYSQTYNNDQYASNSAQSGSCPSFYRNLSRGMRGSDVATLQKYLKNLGYYTYPSITGYYGSATESAVQKFQAKYGVVSSGSPASTGYGVFGPATRRKVASLCAFSGVGSNYDKAVSDFIVTPKAGSIPFVSAVKFKYTGMNCTSFVLDWGDGSTPVTQISDASSCDNFTVKKTAKHTYVKKGDFIITLTVTRNGKTERYMEQVHSGTPVASHFDIGPTSGEAPLLVGASFTLPDSNCSSYRLDWGDGKIESKDASVSTQEECSHRPYIESMTHTYNAPGDYALKLYMGVGSADNAILVEQRNVTAIPASGENVVKVGKIVITNTNGSSPLVTKVHITGTGAQCFSYLIDWGDGTAPQIRNMHGNADGQCDDESTLSEDLVHTYFIPGRYTMRVKAGLKPLSMMNYEQHFITVNN